jgi:hypothetical protein
MGLLTRQLLAAFVLISLSACQTFGGQPPRPYETGPVLTNLASRFQQEIIDDCLTQSGDAHRACRDKIILGQVRAIDIVFVEYEKALQRLAEKVNVAGDSIISVLGAAGAVVNGDQTKSILSALSAAVTGTKGSVEKNLYLKQTSHALIGRMRALRKEALVPIRQGLLQPPDKYPLSQAIFDVESYFSAGTLPAALTDIEQASAEKNKTAEEEVQSTIQATFGVDDNTVTIRNFVRPGGKVDAERVRALHEWLGSNVEKGLDWATLANAKEYAEARRKALPFVNNYGPDENTAVLRNFWKPSGKEDAQRTRTLREWIEKNAGADVSVESFLYFKQYTDKRKEAVAALVT